MRLLERPGLAPRRCTRDRARARARLAIVKASPPDSAGPRESRRDPVIEAYKAGVDRSLLRENLKRSPTERLENLQALQGFADEVRRAGKRQRTTR